MCGGWPGVSRAREERFRDLYETARRQLGAYALRRTATAEEAADVVAETFTIAWRRLEDVPTGEGAQAWLYGTARRVIANSARSSQTRSRLVRRIGDELAGGLRGPADPGYEDALLARRVLAGLGEGDRELLMLVAWEGLGATELGVALGCSPAAACLRLHRARAKLRQLLAASGAQTGTESACGEALGLPKNVCRGSEAP